MFRMAACYHGGSFWDALGTRFDRLGTGRAPINADVLDAWFPPAPGVLSFDPDWLCRTSPPTHAEGLEEVISERRGAPIDTVMAGAGSSALIFDVMRSWLKASDRILLLEPTYGEYAHVAAMIGCGVDRFVLRPEENFEVDMDAFRSQIQAVDYALIVIVNPNNPTGQVIPRKELSRLLGDVPPWKRVLIDEAYIDYVGDESCERIAAASSNVFVLKSMSKGFALSGLRVAYLVGPAPEIRELRRWRPPWAVSLVAQVAAVRALGSESYYQAQYAETRVLRDEFVEDLCRLGISAHEGSGNWVLCHTPDRAAEIVDAARKQGVFLRNAGKTASSLGNSYVRIAVRPREEKRAILQTLASLR